MSGGALLNTRRVAHSYEIEIEVLSQMRAREITGDVSELAQSRGPVAAGGPDMATLHASATGSQQCLACRLHWEVGRRSLVSEHDSLTDRRTLQISANGQRAWVVLFHLSNRGLQIEWSDVTDNQSSNPSISGDAADDRR